MSSYYCNPNWEKLLVYARPGDTVSQVMSEAQAAALTYRMFDEEQATVA